jgi:LCP family protein required for cell wall assembly
MADADGKSRVRGAVDRLRRTRGQKATIVTASIVTFLCFATAGALAFGQYVVEQRQIVDISNPAEAAAAATTSTANETREASPTTDWTPVSIDASATTSASATPKPPATFPAADPDAKNFLVTGADNGSCIDPDSPFAPAFGDRTQLGERSDTIMVWRVDPGADRAAVLSFPRDLWVTIAGSGSQSRINSAYRRNEPQLLIDTIYENFGIGIDHFIQVDFCAFKTLVNAVGGVSVPFTMPTRDTNTGLNVPQAGCFKFDGDHALAYVRSRYYEYLPNNSDPVNGWQMDQSFDLGRISRQQDFMRRMFAKVLNRGALNPRVARGLISTTRKYVVTDNELSPRKLLEFAGVLRAIDPNGIPSYQVASSGATIAGNSVLIPEVEASGMPDVLALFRGERSLSRLPDQAPPTAATAPRAPSSTGSAAPPTTSAATATVAPVDDAPAQIQYGIVPDPTRPC